MFALLEKKSFKRKTKKILSFAWRESQNFNAQFCPSLKLKFQKKRKKNHFGASQDFAKSAKELFNSVMVSFTKTLALLFTKNVSVWISFYTSEIL